MSFLCQRSFEHPINVFYSFSVSFATFSEITNDEQTRMFLIMEVGAGHHEVHRSLMAHRTPA
jgi:hypothetical protein